VDTNRPFQFHKRSQLFICVHNEALSLKLSVSRRSRFTCYTTNRICDTLPIVPFTLGNEQIQRFEHFLFTELGDELFNWRSISPVIGD